MKRYPYTYNPGLMDATDPTVIRGRAIARGSRVRVAREFNPPMFPGVFRMIQDKDGNVQSVFKFALRRETK